MLRVILINTLNTIKDSCFDTVGIEPGSDIGIFCLTVKETKIKKKCPEWPIYNSVQGK